MGQVLGHLLGTLGPSGFGSKSTAEDVIEMWNYIPRL
jgi:hypothetical protein